MYVLFDLKQLGRGGGEEKIRFVVPPHSGQFIANEVMDSNTHFNMAQASWK